MKTLFLFLRQGISNRNLLRTDFFKTLVARPEVRLVILSPAGDDGEFRREFEAPNVCVEQWPRTRVGFWERRLKNLKDYVWVSRGLTQAIRVRRLAQLGRAGLLWRDLVGRLARRIGVTEQQINDWELAVYKEKQEVARLYDLYKPDLVIFTRPFGTNMHAMKEATRRRVRVLCLVESWDNFICKGPLSVVPDRMAVWNEGMRREAEELHGFPPERVDVVGVPQFDLYADTAQLMERREFFETHGLDPERKLLTYGASTEGFIPDEPRVVEKLCEIIEAGRLGAPAQLLIRIHPISSPGLREEYFRRFAGRPNVVVQQPGRPSRLHDGWDPTWSDMLMMASTIFWSDLVVNVASTLTIDAVALDRPVVCIAFAEGIKESYFRDIFERSHYRKLAETGGLRLAYSAEELIAAIRDYIVDPTLDSLGRRRLREELCYRLDGQSARRAAEVALKEMGIGVRPDATAARVDAQGRGDRSALLPGVAGRD